MSKERNITIANEKQISSAVLLSNAFYVKNGGTWYLFKPTETKEGKAYGFYIKDGKRVIYRPRYENLYTVKQYNNKDFLSEKKMLKHLIRNNESLIGNCVCYVLRGVAYNATVIKTNPEDANKMIIEFFLENGKKEFRSVAKNKLYTISNLENMTEVVNDNNYKEVDQKYTEAESEDVKTSEINVMPELPKTAAQLEKEKERAKLKAIKVLKMKADREDVRQMKLRKNKEKAEKLKSKIKQVKNERSKQLPPTAKATSSTSPELTV